MERKRTYLRLGDKVTHKHYSEWGEGVVVEEMTSTIEGGTCLVRIKFEDGRQRAFHNDLDTELCCYYFGVRKLWGIDEAFEGPARRPTRRRLPSR